MKLSNEVKFILGGGSRKDLKLRKDGRYSEPVLKFLADNSIPF